MKKFLSFSTTFLLITSGIFAQAPDFEWAKQAEGRIIATPVVSGNAIDGSGNSYVTGQFTGSATFGSTTLLSNGSDIFIAKYDAAGNAVWAKKAGGASEDYGYDIALDGSGNIYLTGAFTDKATFGSIDITSFGVGDIFIAKYDAAGNAVWVQKAGGTNNEWGTGIAIDGSGNSYVTGTIQGTANFGSIILTSISGTATFIAKYDAAGNAVWAQKADGTSAETIGKIAIDGSGNSYIMGSFGYFGGSATFGSIILPITGRFNQDLFVAKYDAAGNVLWAQKAGGPNFDLVKDIAVDGSGNSYITGSFGASFTFGSTTITTIGSDIFIAKYDAEGNALWAQKAGANFNNSESSNGIVVDGSGNSYITGYFQGSATFNSTTLTSSGSYDIFIAKYNAAGNAVWAKKTGGTGVDDGYNIAVDGNSNIYVTGNFQGSTSFGSTVLTSGGNEIFIAKYDAAGDAVWAQNTITFSSNDEGRAIATDENGNSYVTGNFNGNITFGSIVLTGSGISDIFIAKYDATGNVLWAKKAGGTGSDNGFSIAIDGSGNSYITGYFQGSSTFGNTNLTSSGSFDIFIAKYDAAGNEVWAKKAGGSSQDIGYGITADGSGNSYITGQFQGSATFGSTTITSSGSIDIFIAKYDAAGNAVWATKAGGTSDDQGRSIAVDGSGNTYVTGVFKGIVPFGGTILNSSGSFDIFMAKYDAAGNAVWAKKAGGTSDDQGRSIAVDGSGNSYITGYFQSSATFGSTILTSSGSVDIFIAKYDALGNVLWAKIAGGTGNDQGISIALDGSANPYVTGVFSNNATFGGTSLSSSTGSLEIFIAKYNDAGNIVWAKKAEGLSASIGFGIAVDVSGNSYVTGRYSTTITLGNTILNAAGIEMFIAKLRNCALPVAICKNITVQLDASGHVSITAQDIDNGSSAACGIQSLTMDVTEFSCADAGTNTVTLTVTDSKGNTSTCQATVTVLDNKAPIINCPANTFVQYGNDESPVANGTATATDNCAGVIVGTPSDVTANGPGNNKTIIRTWTATDVSNNTATCNQTITVCDMGVSLGNDRNVFFGIPGFPGASAAITATISGGLTGVTYLWTSTDPSVNRSTTQSVTPTGYSDGQVITYTVTATALNGCTATRSVKITYININCSNNGNTVKVKVCKITPGNTTNCNSICVSMNAYQALLDNGSYLGNCLPNCAAPVQQKGIPEQSKYTLVKQTMDVKVFNNPSHSFFSLYVYGDYRQKVSLRVTDIYGRVLEQRNNLSTAQEIRVGDSYVAGAYMVEVMQGENRKVVKLIKQ